MIDAEPVDLVHDNRDLCQMFRRNRRHGGPRSVRAVFTLGAKTRIGRRNQASRCPDHIIERPDHIIELIDPHH